jgi:hypothetical protein
MANLTGAQLRTLAKNAGCSDSAANTAGAIAMVESSGNPDAGAGSLHIGLWQIGIDAHPQYANSDLTDPTVNAAAMYAISNNGTDFSPWLKFEAPNAYKKYLYKGPSLGFTSLDPITNPLTNPIKAATDAGQVGGGVVSTVVSSAEATGNLLAQVGSVLGDITQGAFWKRLGIGALGVVLMIVAVAFLLADTEHKSAEYIMGDGSTKKAGAAGAESGASEAATTVAEGAA